MPAAMLTPDRPPPEDYYQNNCRSLFAFVLQRYADLVDARVADQLSGFLGSSDDAQRLFARLLTRKGPLIRVDSLAYAEIRDTPGALAELSARGFIRLDANAPGDLLLAMLRKAELQQLAPACVTSGARKQELIDHLVGRYSDVRIVERVRSLVSWAQIAEPAVWRLVRLLYFGDTEHDWSAFVIRDLGMVEYEPVAMRTRRFETIRALERDLRYRELGALSRRVEEHDGLAAELTPLLRENVDDRFVESRRQRALLRIGRWYERAQQPDGAVDAYRLADVHPARERIVRVLHKAGEEAAAKQWLAQIRAAPFSEEEAQFAERFGKRRAGYQPPVTELRIDRARADIEMQALELIVEPGAWGAHVENGLVRSLTGLLYWDLIFADVPGAFTNPFQFGPHDLYREDFLSPREAELAAIENALADDDVLVNRLHGTVERKQGVANSLVNWQLLAELGIERIVAAMPAGDIRRLGHFMIRNVHSRRAGLPDLFVVHGPGDYEFVEVKGPNDQLQPGQRVWFKHLERLDIPARIVKLRLVN